MHDSYGNGRTKNLRIWLDENTKELVASGSTTWTDRFVALIIIDKFKEIRCGNKSILKQINSPNTISDEHYRRKPQSSLQPRKQDTKDAPKSRAQKMCSGFFSWRFERTLCVTTTERV
jgi:hypothetical protein